MPVKVSRGGAEKTLTIKVTQRPGAAELAGGGSEKKKKGKKHEAGPDTGMTLEDVTADVARELDMPKPTGALVTATTYGGPADRAGLMRGDVILEVDRKTIKDTDSFYSQSSRTRRVICSGFGALDPQGHEVFSVVVLDLKGLRGIRPKPVFYGTELDPLGFDPIFIDAIREYYSLAASTQENPMAAKFTNSAQEALQQAQAEAIRRDQQEIQPEHLLYALLSEDGDGSAVVPNVIQVAGADPSAVKRSLEATLNSLPKVTGGAGQIYASNALNRLMVMAEDEAKKIGDEYVSGEHFLLGAFQLAA